MKKLREVIVVGGGLAGLAASLRLAEHGCLVKIVSVTKVKRSHSVCAQGGINAALNLKGEEDSPYRHAYDTLKGGEFLANQPPVLEMCLAAPRIIEMLDRFGCPFNRTPEGHLDARRFGGTLYNRTVFCGASTGQQLLYTLDEQVRRHEVAGRVEKYEFHEFLRLVQDEEGRARGIVFLNLFNQKTDVLKGDAVVVATGGPGLIFKQSTNSTICTGAANGRLFLQGMHYANGEFIQIHPTAIPGPDKLRLISESVRGEGGRIWVWGDSSKHLTGPKGEAIPCGVTGEKWYFLEELYPAYGNLVARDVAARDILRVCELGLGIGGSAGVYLDATHLSAEKKKKLASVFEIYQKFTGDDPCAVPMRIFPAVHYSMGGAWVDWPAADDPNREKRFRHMTNLGGCFNCGESDYQYHGANRLGANSLLSCLFGGLVTGDEVARYVDGLPQSYADLSSSIYTAALAEAEASKQSLLCSQGGENVYCLHEELAEVMVRHVTVVRSNAGLLQAIEKIQQLQERAQRLSLADTSRFANQTLQFALQFGPMLALALVMAKSALLRNEFRGSHFKPEYPLRDDTHWLKTTVATYTPEGPAIHYEPVDIRHFPPENRDYTVAKASHPPVARLPVQLRLPL